MTSLNQTGHLELTSRQMKTILGLLEPEERFLRERIAEMPIACLKEMHSEVEHLIRVIADELGEIKEVAE